MLRIEIIHSPRLIDGEVTNKGKEIIKTEKAVSINKIYQYRPLNEDSKFKGLTDYKKSAALHLQIGNFLQKDFIERILFDDEIYIEEIK